MGRPKGSVDKKPRSRDENLQLLYQAIRQVEREQSEKLWHRVVTLAWNDSKLMTHVLKKILPDMRQTETTLHMETQEDWVKKLELDRAAEKLDANDSGRSAEDELPPATTKRLTVIR